MRKYVILVMALFLNIFAINSQTIGKSVAQQMVEESISSGLFIVRNSFQIIDMETSDIYGLNGKEEFGSTFSVGIKLPMGFCLIDKAVKPWEYDSKYDKYKEGYDPIFYKSVYSEMNNPRQFDSLSFDLSKQAQLIDDVLYKFETKSFGDAGFTIDSSPGEKDGWLIWVVADKVLTDSVINTVFITKKKEIRVEETVKKVDVSLPNDDFIPLGGIYVVPYYPEIGKIDIKLCGILGLESKEWHLYFPFVNSEKESGGNEMAPSVKQEQPNNVNKSDSVLTPVKSKSKNKGKKKKRKDKK